MSLILICELGHSEHWIPLAHLLACFLCHCHIRVGRERVTGGMKLPVVRLARMGGQYAKPRSKQTEIVDGVEMPSFR